MNVHHITVLVAGKSYQLSGAEEPSYFSHIAEMTDRRIRETSQQNPSLSPEGAAVAAALSLADELVKSPEVAARLRRQLEEMEKDA